MSIVFGQIGAVKMNGLFTLFAIRVNMPILIAQNMVQEIGKGFIVTIL